VRMLASPPSPTRHLAPWPTHSPPPHLLGIARISRKSAFWCAFQEREWCRGCRGKLEKQSACARQLCLTRLGPLVRTSFKSGTTTLPSLSILDLSTEYVFIIIRALLAYMGPWGVHPANLLEISGCVTQSF